MMKNVKKATAEFATSKTFVWWDMDSCPLPNGYDPCQVGPRIDTELKNLGYNGPLSIIAVGNLDGVPHDFLKALSSGGVVIKQPSLGNDMIECVSDALYLEDEARFGPPVTMMLITGAHAEALETIVCEFFKGGPSYNLLLAYPAVTQHADPEPSSLLVNNFGGQWFWDRSRSGLLKDLGSAYNVTRRQDTGSEMHCCELCDFSSPSFDAFATHLKTPSHAVNMDEYLAYLEDKSNRYFELYEASKLQESYIAKVMAKRHELVNPFGDSSDDDYYDDSPKTEKSKRRLKKPKLGKRFKFALLCKSSSLKKKKATAKPMKLSKEKISNKSDFS